MVCRRICFGHGFGSLPISLVRKSTLVCPESLLENEKHPNFKTDFWLETQLRRLVHMLLSRRTQFTLSLRPTL